MTNNQIFRDWLFLTSLNTDKDLIAYIFELGGQKKTITDSEIKSWRSRPNDRSYRPMPDNALSNFVQGLYKYRDEQREININVFNFTGETK